MLNIVSYCCYVKCATVILGLENAPAYIWAINEQGWYQLVANKTIINGKTWKRFRKDVIKMNNKLKI